MGQSGIARAWHGSETDSKAVELRGYAWCRKAKKWTCNDQLSTAKEKRSGAWHRTVMEWQETELICLENKFGGKKNEGNES